MPSSPLRPLDENALLALGRWLGATGYRFTTVTPRSHATVNARPGNRQADCLAGIFGWSRPFTPDTLPAPALALLRAAGGAIERPDGLLTSAVRFSTLDGLLLAHSAFPTEAEDAVFFGPDTYRFAALADRVVSLADTGGRAPRLVDVGCGSGAGGLHAAKRLGDAAELHLVDINPRALQFARVNSQLNGVPAHTVQSDLYAALEGSFDLILANPPYLCDEKERAYRHGAGKLGTGLSLRIVEEGLPRLAPGGTLVLYTGAPVVAGVDQLLEALRPLLDPTGFSHRYEELDPDVFGEELEHAAYEAVDRIAVVGLTAKRVA
jgi:SAM-dependent methyltransferase